MPVPKESVLLFGLTGWRLGDAWRCVDRTVLGWLGGQG
jgi:hypothetical protein